MYHISHTHTLPRDGVVVALEAGGGAPPHNILHDRPIDTPRRPGRIDAVEAKSLDHEVVCPVPVQQRASSQKSV